MFFFLITVSPQIFVIENIAKACWHRWACGAATQGLREGRYINDRKIKAYGRIRQESLSSWDFLE